MILQIILSTLSLLLSMWGLMIILMGFSTFLLLPMISTVSRFKAFSQFFLRLATFPLSRAGFVVSESNEIYFKQINLELGLLNTTLDGDLKLIEDPAQRMHHWLGMRFGLVNEQHGVVFDPRDAALGMRKRLLDDNDEGEYLATEDEWQEWGVSKWKPAAFEMPQGYELVDLSAVKDLIDGGERAEYAKRVEELYKHSRNPFGAGLPWMQYLMPIIGFSVPFFGIWLMVSQIGQPSSTVSFGAGFLGFILSTTGVDLKDRLKDIDWRYVGGIVLLVGTPLVILLLLALFVGPILTISISVIFALGMLIMPLFTLLGKAVSPLGGALSKLYFKLGFMGYRKPVFEWTPATYELREYNSLPKAQQQTVTWYDAFGTTVGFTYTPEPESWGAEYMPHKEIESQQPVADGGQRTIDSNLPPKYVRSDQIKRDTYGGYLPKRVKDSMYYLHSGIAMNRFANTAIGEKALRKLLEAKQEHGEGSNGLEDSTVFKTTLVAGLLGAIAGIGIFLLPSIL